MDKLTLTRVGPNGQESPLSLYANYIKEREGKEIVESDKGFATFKQLNDGIYIEDIYVVPEHRKSDVASKMADQIAGIAKELGFSKLYGSCSPSAYGSTTSLKVLLAYGFQLHSAQPNFILMVKEI